MKTKSAPMSNTRLIRRLIDILLLMPFFLSSCAMEPDDNGNYDVSVQNNTEANYPFTYFRKFNGEINEMHDIAFAKSSVFCVMQQGGITIQSGTHSRSIPVECSISSCTVIIDSINSGIIDSINNAQGNRNN